MDNSNITQTDKKDLPANASKESQKEWIYLAGVPGGLEDVRKIPITEKYYIARVSIVNSRQIHF